MNKNNINHNKKNFQDFLEEKDLKKNLRYFPVDKLNLDIVDEFDAEGKIKYNTDDLLENFIIIVNSITDQV